MSESGDYSTSLVTRSPLSTVAHENAIAPDQTLVRLAEVLELSDQPAQFEEAFAEYARGLTGARAASSRF